MSDTGVPRLEHELIKKVINVEEHLSGSDHGYSLCVRIDVDLGDTTIPVYVRPRWISIHGFIIPHEKAYLLTQLLNDMEHAIIKTGEQL